MIWSRKTGVAVKVIEESSSEIRTICCNKDTVFASGTDSKVISVKLIKEQKITGSIDVPKSWVYAGSLRG